MILFETHLLAIVQFQYGDDKLDPVDMEGKAKPVHFDRTFIHSESTTYNNDEPSLMPAEIMRLAKRCLSKERAKLFRKDLLGNDLRTWIAAIMVLINSRVHVTSLTLFKNISKQRPKADLPWWRH